MRTVGLVLATLGALALGSQGFAAPAPAAAESAAPARVVKETIPPVAGGIALTGGLLLLATGTRRY